jgi:hypothetical protein
VKRAGGGPDFLYEATDIVSINSSSEAQLHSPPRALNRSIGQGGASVQALLDYSLLLSHACDPPDSESLSRPSIRPIKGLAYHLPAESSLFALAITKSAVASIAREIGAVPPDWRAAYGSASDDTRSGFPRGGRYFARECGSGGG